MLQTSRFATLSKGLSCVKKMHLSYYIFQYWVIFTSSVCPRMAIRRLSCTIAYKKRVEKIHSRTSIPSLLLGEIHK